MCFCTVVLPILPHSIIHSKDKFQTRVLFLCLGEVIVVQLYPLTGINTIIYKITFICLLLCLISCFHDLELVVSLYGLEDD